jgi:hypothetical protein
MLITLIASRPTATKITAMTPWTFLPMARQRRLWVGRTRASSKKGLVDVAKIKTVLAEIGQTLRLVPHDFHLVLL